MIHAGHRVHDIPNYSMSQLSLYLKAADAHESRLRAYHIIDANLAFGGDEQTIKKTLKALTNV